MKEKATLLDYLQTVFLFPMTVIIGFFVGLYAMSLTGSLQHRFNNLVDIMVYVIENQIIAFFSMVFWLLLIANSLVIFSSAIFYPFLCLK